MFCQNEARNNTSYNTSDVIIAHRSIHQSIHPTTTYINFIESGMAFAVHGRRNVRPRARLLLTVHRLATLGLLLSHAARLVARLAVILRRLVQRVIRRRSVATAVGRLRKLAARGGVRSCHLLWIHGRPILEAARHHVAAVEVRVWQIQHGPARAGLLRHSARHVAHRTRVIVRSREPPIGHGRVSGRHRANVALAHSSCP